MSLQGKKVVITRPKHQSDTIIKRLEAKGAIPIFFPTIEIKMAADTAALDQAIKNIEAYDWVVITSANGVNFFLQRMEELGIDSAILNKKKIATVGTVTQEKLASKNIKVDFIPAQFVADILGETLPINKGDKVLLPQSDIARKKLISQLKDRGAIVNSFTAYETRTKSIDLDSMNELIGSDLDWICFTSASTAKGLEQAFKDHQKEIPNTPCAVIGPVTQKAALAKGFNVVASADPHTVDGLIAAMTNNSSQY